MWAFFGAWTQGATLFLDGDTSPFDPERTVQLLHEHPITTFCGAPIIYRQLVGSGSDAFARKPPKALKHCTSAGENLASRVIMDWHEMTGLIVYNGFGQTETSILCGSFPSMSPKKDSMGIPLPGVPLEILNDEGQIAAPFEEGDIAVNVSEDSEFRGIFEGYILDDGSVSRPTVTDEDGQIWYLTGDRAHSDEYGYFYYKGRGDDVIISAGHRIGKSSWLFKVE
jgi:medium-chain acyl-CoA synthetase